MSDQTPREAISREQFAHAVRDTENQNVERGGHHPDISTYTPSAFRHYTRERALLRRLRDIEFSTVLDVGCSEGHFMEVFRRTFGADVWGVDLSTVAARNAHANYGLRVATGDATRLPLPDNSFDLVLATETIEHVLDPADMLAEMRRVSRRWVLITTPISESADQHEPDYELEEEGHVNNFDPATMHELCGPTASYGGFHNNSTFAVVAAGGRKLPAPFRNWFYDLDLAVSQRIGKPMHRSRRCAIATG